MKRMITVTATAALAAVLSGCSATAPTAAQANRVTYDWQPTSRIARVQFDDNNTSCQRQAERVSQYENCMIERGYTLANR